MPTIKPMKVKAISSKVYVNAPDNKRMNSDMIVLFTVPSIVINLRSRVPCKDLKVLAESAGFPERNERCPVLCWPRLLNI